MLPFQRSLLSRIVVSFLALFLSIVALMAGLTYSFFISGTEARVTERIEALSRARVQMLDRWVDDQARHVRFTAGLSEVRMPAQALCAPGNVGRAAAHAALGGFVDGLRREYPEIGELLVLARDGGRVVFSTDPTHEGQYRVLDGYFIEGLAGPSVQRVYPSPVTLQPTMTASVPLRGAGDGVIGVLAVHLNLDTMDRIVNEPVGLGRSGEAYLVDGYNVFVSSGRFGRADYPRGVHSTGIDAALTGSNGSGEYRGYAGAPVIGVYRWLPRWGLALLVEVNREEAYAPARTQTTILAAVGLALALASAAAVYLLARQIARPILAVQQAAVRVAEGDMKAQAPVVTRDEIGALATSFNTMTARVRELYDEVLRKEEHFRSLIESSLDLLAVFDREITPTFVGPSVEKVLGWTPAEVLCANPFDLVNPEDLPRVREEAFRLIASPGGSSLQLAFRVLHKDGGWRTLDATVRNLLEHPSIRGIVLSARDMTNWKALEERLVEAHKLEAVGRLAGGVAHDFNNLLTAVLGYSEALLSEKSLDREGREWVSEIRKAAERAATLTRQLLAYSRKQVLQPRVVDINALVTNLRSLLGRLIGENVEIRTRLSPGLLRVKADPNQLEQVIMNLALNARDAMPEGGEIAFSTSNVALGGGAPEGAAEYPGAAPGAYVELAVRDTGVGMPAEVLGRIFDPFYTTKGVGRGTGLGLSVAYGIMKQSGGHITVESEVGKGSTFRILLPATLEESLDADVDARPDRLPAGSEAVLVVEDEDSVRRMIAMILGQAGYAVQAEADPEAAIRFARSAPRLDLVVTDVVLPGMNGRVMAEALAEIHPQVRVLYISGYTEDEVLRGRALQEGFPFLQKPFLPNVLARRVREILDSR